jgi:hypothetical protein
MSAADHAPTDPRQVLQSLDAGALRARLREIAGEARALRTLLRAADARERDRYSRAGQQQRGGGRG